MTRCCECHVLEVWPKSFDETDLTKGNGHEGAEGDICTSWLSSISLSWSRAVTVENFHFSQRRAVFEISWKECGQDLELRVHIEPKEVDEES